MCIEEAGEEIPLAKQRGYESIKLGVKTKQGKCAGDRRDKKGKKGKKGVKRRDILRAWRKASKYVQDAFNYLLTNIN